MVRSKTVYPFAPCVGYFNSPWRSHPIEATNGFWCLFQKTLAKSGKQNCLIFETALVGFEPRLVSQRIVFDAIAAAGGVLSVPIKNPLLSYAHAAWQKYMTYLDEQKAKRAAVITDVNAKRKFGADALEKLESKRRRLDNDVKALQASADELANSAESSGDLTLLSKCNALRKCAKQKAVQQVQCPEEVCKTEGCPASLTP